MKKVILMALALMAASGLRAEIAQTLFLIGEPAGGWDTSKGIQMTKTADGVFETDVDFSGTNSFGFVKELNSSGDWTAFNSCRYTPASSGEQPMEGANDMIYTGDDSNDYCWDLGAGKWHFKVDTGAMKFYLSVGSGDTPEPPAPVTDLYFVGEVNDWQFLDEYVMTADGPEYTYSAWLIRGGISFKLSDKDWKTAYTSKNEQMTVGQTYDLFTGDGLANMAFATDIEDAELLLDVDARTLTVRGTAGIDNVSAEMEDSPAEYYTLDGKRVVSPDASGIYIRKQGSRVTKVVIR